MTTRTLAELEREHGVQVDEHLDRQLDVPVSTGMQRQGDVIVIPAATATRLAVSVATYPVPQNGVAVVRGENGGNTHLLLGAGDVRYNTIQGSSDLDLGVLTVAPGATAYLAHPEHGFAGVGPGTYVVRRQREQADQIRMVAD